MSPMVSPFRPTTVSEWKSFWDGIVTINVTPGEGQTEEEAVQEILNTPLDALGQTGRVLGDCTTGELIALMAELIGTLG